MIALFILAKWYFGTLLALISILGGGKYSFWLRKQKRRVVAQGETTTFAPVEPEPEPRDSMSFSGKISLSSSPMPSESIAMPGLADALMADSAVEETSVSPPVVAASPSSDDGEEGEGEEFSGKFGRDILFALAQAERLYGPMPDMPGESRSGGAIGP